MRPMAELRIRGAGDPRRMCGLSIRIRSKRIRSKRIGSKRIGPKRIGSKRIGSNRISDVSGQTRLEDAPDDGARGDGHRNHDEGDDDLVRQRRRQRGKHGVRELVAHLRITGGGNNVKTLSGPGSVKNGVRELLVASLLLGGGKTKKL